ncbi:MAG TPA: hypothetical protein VLK84_14820 [Longimicrobium sp.]|nr:hypothetical protein [Longimicrobium sp.]
MADQDDVRGPESTNPADGVREPAAGAPADEMPEFKPIPPEMYQRPGGCGFTGCMYAVMIFAALALALLVIGLLTREWLVPLPTPKVR